MTHGATAIAAAAAALGLVLAAPPLRAQDQAAAVPFDAARGVLSYAALLGRAQPAVVRIFAIGRSPETGEEGVIGSGSGVIVDAALGEILTNNHVVEPATKLQVQFADGRTVAATLVGADKPTDVALVRVAAGGLTALPIADSDTIQVGDVAFAIGYPLGLDQTVTMGIVSGLSRSGIGDGLEDYIQTDAPVNHGNSGGPLIDSRGRLIGLNAAILSEHDGGNIGIAFAVPTRIAMAIADQLRRNGRVRRGQIGIATAPVTAEVAAREHMRDARGALVASVEPGTPAARAGLRAGDVVVSVDGRPVTGPGSLATTVGIAEPGKAITLGYVRGGARHEATMTIEAPRAVAVAGGAGAAGPVGAFGAQFRDANAGDRLAAGLAGAVVAFVAPGSPAAQRGLLPGELIVAVNGERIGSAAELAAKLRGARGAVQLAVVHGNSIRPLTLGD